MQADSCLCRVRNENDFCLKCHRNATKRACVIGHATRGPFATRRSTGVAPCDDACDSVARKFRTTWIGYGITTADSCSGSRSTVEAGRCPVRCRTRFAACESNGILNAESNGFVNNRFAERASGATRTGWGTGVKNDERPSRGLDRSTLAERVGFEPTDRLTAVTSLAGRRVRPDSATSPRRQTFYREAARMTTGRGAPTRTGSHRRSRSRRCGSHRSSPPRSRVIAAPDHLGLRPLSRLWPHPAPDTRG